MTLEGPGSYSPTRENKQSSQYEFTDYGLLYKTTLIKNIVTIFGAEVKHTKSGNALIFSKQKVENLVKMRNERRINVRKLDSGAANKSEGSEGSQYSESNVRAHHNPRDSTIGEGSEGSEGSIEEPPTFIEVYHGIEANRMEVFPSISSRIMYSYLKDSLNINSQSSIYQTILVGHKTGGASVMPSLPSLPSPATNTSNLSHIDSSSLESEKKIKFTPDFDASEPTFWCIFKELANENNGSVSYYKLQERLISTGKLDAGGSVLMIEHIEKTGKIEKTGDYNVYRIGKLVPTKEEWDSMR